MYAGRPDRTAQVVHDVVHQQFGTGRGGLPGNDDSGGLSSWYVWATLGLFPVAGQNLFLLNAPAWRESRLDIGGRGLTVETTGFVEPEPGGPVQHVQSVHLDGVPLDRPFLTGGELHAGGRLLIGLGPEPSGWGTQHRPPSARAPQVDVPLPRLTRP
jgi:putative alpha-1,2-mannosidase